MQILITGAAGFIGYHLTQRLLAAGHRVCGLDSLNDYYDVTLKLDRLQQLKAHPSFTFQHLDIADRKGIPALFAHYSFDSVVNLAAQAGVRASLDRPFTYIDSNIVGFANLLEACRSYPVQHLVFASSSSVYGANTKVPFATTDSVDQPISLYAATKKANELMAYTYSHLYGIPTTGLRFFTVYGPWGRPDMAYFKFVQAIVAGRPIDIYNFGNLERDFTYVDDIVEGLVRILNQPPTLEPHASPPQNAASQTTGQRFPAPPYRLYNIGNSAPVNLLTFIEIIEQALGQTTTKNLLPMQPGEVFSTYADTSDLARDFDFKPDTSLTEGIEKFVAWFQTYYG